MNDKSTPGRPPRLDFIFQNYLPPLYFVTLCTHNRKAVLANATTHQTFIDFCQTGFTNHQIAVGHYVIMPDHIHLFVKGPVDFKLTLWIRMLKNVLGKNLKTNGCGSPYWQRGFFDHVLRHSESYHEKWIYVWENPRRAGLITRTETWPYQGEITPIFFDKM